MYRIPKKIGKYTLASRWVCSILGYLFEVFALAVKQQEKVYTRGLIVMSEKKSRNRMKQKLGKIRI